MADKGHGSPNSHDSIKGLHEPQQKSSREKANCISKYLTFWWLNDLLSRGFKKPLKENDLDELISLNGLGIEETSHELQKNWSQQVSQYKDTAKNPSLLQAVAKTYGLRYSLLFIFAILVDGLAIAQPLFLKKLIKYFTVGSHMTEKDAYMYALAVSLCSVASLVLTTPYYYQRKMTGLQAKEGCITLLYDKILKLSPAAFSSFPNLNISTLVSSDVAKVDAAFFYLHYIILGPIEAVVVLYLIWNEIGPSSLAGMGLLFLLVPMQIKMSHFIMNLRRQTVQVIDHRLKIMREIISGIRVIKMYVYEDFLHNLIGRIRGTEIGWLKRMSMGKAMFTSLFFSSPALISFLTFLTYVMTGHVLTASKVFTCVSLFNSVRVVMTLLFPVAMSCLNDMRVALERIQKVLLLEDLCPTCQGLQISDERPKPEECSIVAIDISASWTKGKMLAILGEIGSGKSSLLQAILGELPLSEGSMKIKGKIAYTSQQPWVYNGTLRENVVFGKDYEQTRYNEVIKACALERDIELLPEGDMSLVGERGVALSGGQRARISLARAVYSESDIYLLDDPLSAVDIHIGKHIYTRCIMGFLSSKARILVTHQFRYAKEADHIIALSEGECVARGTFDDIRKSGIDLVSMCPAKTAEEEEEIKEIQSSLEANVQVQHVRRYSGASSMSAALRQGKMFHNMEVTHEIAGTIEDTDGDVVAPQVAVFEENRLPRETKHEGAVAVVTYVEYFKSLHSIAASVIVLILFSFAQVLYILADWWLSYWSNNEEKSLTAPTPSPNATAIPTPPPRPDRDLYLGVYAAIVFGLLFVTIVRSSVFFKICLVASQNLHKKMFSSLLRAPSYFFDVNSIGRILNRFSKDVNYVDEGLPTTFMDFLQTALLTIGVIILVAANNPITFAIVIPVLIIFIFERTYYIRTARDLKRLDSITRSPLYSHFSTTLLGLDTIRAFNAKDTFVHEFHHYLEANTRALFAYISVSSWLTFRLEIMSVVFVSFVTLISPSLRSSLSAGVVGLILTYATKLSSVLQKTVKKSTEVENMMTAVERMIEYCDIQSESPMETEFKPPKGWPDKGEIKFDKVFYSYREDLPPVLKDITFQMESKEKMGVVGRTGAGKSSLLSCLFRMAEPTGLIEIDGIDIKKLGLRDLRNNISVIPQEPILFSTTLRRNLDAKTNHDDAELWGALEQVQLKHYFEQWPSGLDTELNALGSLLSVGQRQLVCLARAILGHSKILVIDEATANVDPMTSKIIWDTINKRFKDCTVITIAHRLFPVMNHDRVMVIDAGRISELDSPYNLLQNPHSYLTHVVVDTGLFEERKLRDIAKTSHYEKMKAVRENNATEEPKKQNDDNRPNLQTIPAIEIQGVENDTSLDTQL